MNKTLLPNVRWDNERMQQTRDKSETNNRPGVEQVNNLGVENQEEGLMKQVGGEVREISTDRRIASGSAREGDFLVVY